MVQSQQVDLIIETRDARMPLTSINPAFEHLLSSSASAGGKGVGLAKRLIVYNKSDLAQDCFREASRHVCRFRPKLTRQSPGSLSPER